MKKGDLVFIDHSANLLVRGEEIPAHGILVGQIGQSWWRVYMSWDEKTKIADFPNHMLKAVVKLDAEKHP